METALLKVRTILLAAIDHKEVTCLILLDLIAAFNMEDHQLLLNCLRFRFGMEGKCLEWIESYLTGRNQQVVIGLLIRLLSLSVYMLNKTGSAENKVKSL